MTKDRSDRRARTLLRLGSGAGAAGTNGEPGVAGAPGLRPGFMERLLARLETEGGAGRADVFGTLARPTLGVALALTILAGVFLFLSPTAPGAGEGGDALATLIDDDPVLGALLARDGEGLWPGIDGVEAGGDDGGDER
jgi:hypothetical protein